MEELLFCIVIVRLTNYIYIYLWKILTIQYINITRCYKKQYIWTWNSHIDFQNKKRQFQTCSAHFCIYYDSTYAIIEHDDSFQMKNIFLWFML